MVTLGTQSRDARSSVGDDDMRQKDSPFREDSMASQSSLTGQGPISENRNPHGAIGNDPSNVKGKETKDSGSQPKDPLAGFSDKDRWGLRGLSHLMHNYPDFNSLVCGVDPAQLGIDLTANESVSCDLRYERHD